MKIEVSDLDRMEIVFFFRDSFPHHILLFVLFVSPFPDKNFESAYASLNSSQTQLLSLHEKLLAQTDQLHTTSASAQLYQAKLICELHSVYPVQQASWGSCVNDRSNSEKKKVKAN